MTDDNTLADYNIKDFDKSSRYIPYSKCALDGYPYDIKGKPRSSYVAFCQVCGWYGYPQEKIIIEFEGICPEDEEGFVDIFTEYDYDTETAEKGNLHIHKYDPELVQEAVDAALKIRDGGN